MFYQKLKKRKFFSFFFIFFQNFAFFGHYTGFLNAESHILPARSGNGKNPEKNSDIFGI